MKKFKQIVKVAALVSTLITSNVSHASPQGLPFDGLYFGLGVNQSDIAINQKNIAARNQLNNQSTLEYDDAAGLNAFIGIKLDEFLSLEMGYSELGTIRLDDGTTQDQFMSVDSLYIDAIMSRRMTDSIDVFARLGLADWELSDSNGALTEDGMGINYGAGFDVNLYGNKSRVMRVEWQHREFDNITLKDGDTISINMMFNFY